MLGYNQTSRGVAQSGSASALGAEGRGFESLRPDHSFIQVRTAKGPSTSLRISPAGSDARKTAQVQIPPPRPFEVLRLRSGFRLRARTPAKRLKFESLRPDHSLHPGPSSQRSFDFAQDFACGLERPQNGSSSNPSAPTIPFILVRAAKGPSTSLRISPVGSDARKAAQITGHPSSYFAEREHVPETVFQGRVGHPRRTPRSTILF